MTILYKILGFIINLVAFFLTVFLVLLIPFVITVPLLWFPTFVIAAMVLYTWFSNKFHRKVLLKQEVVAASLRDWIRVNGIVSIIFCVLNIPQIISFMYKPDEYLNATKEIGKNLGQDFGENITLAHIYVVFSIVLLYSISLLTHVLWTFVLIKKNREYFQ